MFIVGCSVSVCFLFVLFFFGALNLCLSLQHATKAHLCFEVGFTVTHGMTLSSSHARNGFLFLFFFNVLFFYSPIATITKIFFSRNQVSVRGIGAVSCCAVWGSTTRLLFLSRLINVLLSPFSLSLYSVPSGKPLIFCSISRKEKRRH